jgi:signal peptidase I
VPARASNAARATLPLLLDELAFRCRSLARVAALSALVLALGVVAFLGGGIVTNGWRILPVLSGSMEPAFGQGDAVLVTRAPLESVRVGDVIAYHVPVGDRQLTTHRVVRVLEPGPRPVVRTKGDANPVADPWDAKLEGDELWRVEATVPELGRAFLLARSATVRMVLVWLGVGVLLALALHLVRSRGGRAS